MNTDEVVKKITTEIGRRVTKAKDESGYTTTNLALELGISRTTLARKLAGERQFTTLELRHAATLMGRPIEEFLPTPQEAGA